MSYIYVQVYIHIHIHVYINLYCIFFHYHLVPLYSPSPRNHHTVVHVHESFFLFTESRHPLKSPTFSCHSLSTYESISILLVSSVCSLDSKYEWNQMVYIHVWLYTYIYTHTHIHKIKWIRIAFILIVILNKFSKIMIHLVHRLACNPLSHTSQGPF